MFTGIVAELGEVAGIERRGDAARLTIRGSTEDVSPGESIAVNGVCLTVTGILEGTFTADVMGETLDRSGLGALRAGAPVNLERSVRLADRLGGHLVQGHVDGTGEFLSFESLGAENWWLRIRVPAELDPFLVFKGSIAIDGISLTIAALEADVLSVTIIPHTYRNTTLGGYRAGARLNLECDILAKHVEKLLRKLDLKQPLTVDKLRENGY